jgi:O-antigen ligase
MIVTSVVVPALMADPRVDMTRGLFFCFGIAAIINCFYWFGPPQVFDKDAIKGYTGYFLGKNYLGAFAAVALMLSLHEMLYRGHRRVLGLIIGTVSIVLLVASNSKTAMGLAILSPILAAVTVALRRTTRLSPAMVPVSIILAYFVVSTFFGLNIYKISYLLYGDATFTGRRLIWDFAHHEISHRPLLGWGYQSFWLVGPDAPSVVNAPGWVKTMPNAHNGYLDTILETGYVGFVLLLAFLFTTLQAAGRLVDYDTKRGWVIIALAFYILISNGLESLWVRGFEFVWVVFLFVAAEVGRPGRRLIIAGHPAPRKHPIPQPQRANAGHGPQVRRRSLLTKSDAVLR